jgi:hypothetical protein
VVVPYGGAISSLVLPPTPLPPHQQDYIQAENQALEEAGSFECKEILVRMEYKYCPNLTIIDTPGE